MNTLPSQPEPVTIAWIETRIHESFRVTFSNGKHEIINSSQPRRKAAVKRMIKHMNKTTVGGRDPMTQYSPAARIIPLPEHFANAAVAAVKKMNPAEAPKWESAAADELAYVWRNGRAYDFVGGAIRRAVTFKWYSRTLISGKIDRPALIAALNGIE